jgi:hypothetical protein
MFFAPFYNDFPEIAEKETRRIHVLNNPDLPDGEYSLLEAYCDKPGCDCRRVFFNVINMNTGELKAVIAYGWESTNFYADWMGFNISYIIKAMQGPILSLSSPQSEIAPALLKIVKNVVLKDINYVNRLKIHYKMYKDLINGKESEKVLSVKSAIEKKISRNSPCPCGSGKKYKSCCGKS